MDKNKKTAVRVPEESCPITPGKDAAHQNQGHNTKKQALGPNTER